MDRSTENALHALLVAAAELAKTAPVELEPDYLDLIQRVESLPCNRPGSDKTWVHRLDERDQAHFRGARRVS